MGELFENMGFRENPFSRFSAEEEKEYLHNIFVPPKYYATIHSDLKTGSSRFIFGERGVGKSALVLNLKSDFAENRVFCILIDDYEGIKLTANGKEFFALTLKNVVTTFGLYLLKNKQYIRGLSKEEKEKLTFFIYIFFETLSKSQFDDLYNKTTHIKSKNIFRRIINYFVFKPVNIFLSGCSEFIGSTINNALGLPTQVGEHVYKEFFPKLKETSFLEKIMPNQLEYQTMKSMLRELIPIINKCGYNGVVIIYDKIDEYRLLNAQITTIAQFIKDLVLDTSLLLDDSISLVFSLWSRIKQPLANMGVRYDKLKPIDITWTNSDLKKILGDKLAYFSDKKINDIQQIVSEKYVETILHLANGSPRHLIILLSKIYDEQTTIDESVKTFCDEAVEKGLANFASTFDFGIYYSGEKLKIMRKIVKEVLRVQKIEFQTKDLIDTFKISSQAANSKIRIMLSYGIIEDVTVGSRAKQYQVVEPRIEYLIKNNMRLG